MADAALKNPEAAVVVVKKREESAFFDTGVDRSDLGRPDSFRYSILTWVLDEKYDRAIEHLKDFIEGPSEYPNFKPRISRYVNHSIDLIYAIKAKRSFHGINSLTRAKQQELREKFKGHFRELQETLKTVEHIQGDLRIQDARSTIYVVRALWVSLVAIVFMAFWLEFVTDLGRTAYVVLNDLVSEVIDWIAIVTGL